MLEIFFLALDLSVFLLSFFDTLVFDEGFKAVSPLDTTLSLLAYFNALLYAAITASRTSALVLSLSNSSPSEILSSATFPFPTVGE
jgi:hypothetical protein